MVYEYTDKKFEPKFNDFGDDYNKPDIEIQGDKLFKEAASAVKRLKRRYRNYYEYIRAMDIYIDYCNLLVEKHGGLEEIKLKFTLGEIDDYIPAKPELKKTKQNKRLLSMGVGEVIEVRPDNWEPPNPLDYANPVDGPCDFEYVEMSNKEIKKCGLNKIEQTLSSETILNELDLIDRYYQNTHISKKGAKAYKKNMLRMKYKSKYGNDDADVTVSDILRQTEEYEEKMMFGERLNQDSNDLIVQRKGLNISMATMEELETYESLKELGLKISDKMLSKKAFRVVRKNSKAAKKNLKKMKKRKKATNTIAMMTGGQHHSIEDLENELAGLRYRRDGMVVIE